MTDGEKVRRIIALRKRHYNNKGVFDGRADLYLTGLNQILGK